MRIKTAASEAMIIIMSRHINCYTVAVQLLNNSLEWSIDDEGARSSIQEEAVTEEEERCKCIYRQFSCGTVLINSNSHGCHHHHDQERTIKNKILG